MVLNYEYSTGESYYVLLTALVLTVLPATFVTFSGKLANAVSPQSALPLCPGAACAPKNREYKRKLHSRSAGSKFSFGRLLLFAGWALLFYCVYMIATATKVTKEFDPHKILGISKSAKKSEIRAAYRKLSLSQHPDKVPFYQRKEATAKFIEIGKALKVLTNKKARKNWELYGDPDGPGATTFGVALPEWVLNKNFVVIFYLGVLIIVPAIVIRAWNRGAIDLHLGGLRAESLEKIKEIEPLKFDFHTLLLAIACNTEPLDRAPSSDELQNLCQALRSSIPQKREPTARTLLLYAHVTRQLLQPFSCFVASCGRLCEVAMELSLRRKSFPDAVVCIEVMRAISAGRLPSQSLLLQLPYVQLEHIPQNEQTNTAGFGKSGASSLARKLDELLTECSSFAEHYTAAEIAEMKECAASIPQLAIESVKFTGAPWRTILHSESESMQCDIVVRASLPGAPGVNTWVCAQNFPEPRENGFWVLVACEKLVIESRFVAFHQGGSKFVLEFAIPVPQNNGSLPLTVHVASPYYASSDERQSTVKLPVLTKKQKQLMLQNTEAALQSSASGPAGASTAVAHGNEELLASFG